MPPLHQRPSLLVLPLLLAGLAAQPPSDLALRERAFGAENQGRHAEAAAAFLELVDREPLRPEWTVAAGRCLGRSGRYTEAIELLQAAANRFPGVIDIPAMLARTYLLQAELDRGIFDRQPQLQLAIDTATAVLRLDPNHEDTRLVLAQAHYQTGNAEAARREAEIAVQRHPKRAGGHVLLGRLALEQTRQLLDLHRRGQLSGAAEADLVAELAAARQRAEQHLLQAAQLEGGRAHPYLLLAQLALLQDQQPKAREHLLQALAIDPDATTDHSLLEQGYDWQQRSEVYAELLRQYSSRADAKPAKRASLLFHRGRALYTGQQWQAASEQFRAALALHPATHSAHYYLTFCAAQLDDLDAAEQHAASYATHEAKTFATLLGDQDLPARQAAVALLQQLADRAYHKQRTAAARDLNYVLALLLDTADAWNNRALLCRDTGMFEQALDAYRQALAKEPDSPQLLNDYAVVLHHHLPNPTNLARARELYERAIALTEAQLRDPALPPAVRQRNELAREHARKNLDLLRN